MRSTGRKSSLPDARLVSLCCTALLIGVAACDPCAGVSSCNVAPHVGVTGQLLNDTTGRPEAGATIDFVRIGGVALERDSLRTRTDDNGLFGVDIGALIEGEVLADIVVRPLTGPGYRARGVRIQANTRGGEAMVLAPWSSVPHLADVAEIYRRGAGREVLPNTEIEFRRTSGIAFRNLSSGIFSATTNATGLVALFGDVVKPVDAGEVVGDLTIFLPDPPGPSVLRGYRAVSAPDFRYNPRIHRIGAGPSLDYWFRVVQRGRPTAPVAGVVVQFQRTGGIAISPPSWSITTDGSGNVFFPSRAGAEGAVTGDITIIPKAPAKSYSRTGVQFQTFNTDSLAFAGNFGVGPGLQYYVIIRANGVPLPEAQVEFQRTSGISVSPARHVVVTNDSGIVSINPEPASEGEVVGDIRVTPRAPHVAFVVRGVRLIAVDADVPGDRILVGDWDVTRPPTSAIR